MTKPNATTVFFKEMKRKLGPGPTRFAPDALRSIHEQIMALNQEQLDCLRALEIKWVTRNPQELLAAEMYLRFARCQNFNTKAAWRNMKSYDKSYINLSIVQLEQQLLSKTLFPVPNLKCRDGHDVFYMRPSRFVPRETSTRTVINNLAYVMNSMVENEQSCTDGISFLAYMNDWDMHNFCTDYCLQFMSALQGKQVPVKVKLFLIVNPPAWFGKIWAIMKPMLSAEFSKKVHMITESDVHNYLMPNCEDYMPDDMKTGKASTKHMVQDFITYRKYIEGVTSYTTVKKISKRRERCDNTTETSSTGSDPVHLVEKPSISLVSIHQAWRKRTTKVAN